MFISQDFCISSIKRMHQSATGRPTASEYSFRSRYPGIGLKLGAIVVVLVVFCVFIFVDDLGVFQSTFDSLLLSEI